MKLRVQQAVLTCALALPLVVTFVFAGPFTAAPGAQGAMRMVGPRFPILADTNGNGMPDGGDRDVTPEYASGQSQIEFDHYFSCDRALNNRLTPTDRDSSGKFRKIARRNNFRDQSISITSVQGGGASDFSFLEFDDRATRATGSGRVMDSNADGKGDMVQITGKINMMATLVFTPDSGHVSIPTSQANMLGARGGKCGPTFVPQIWVPLADTDGDGKGDTIIADLDGNGLADPQFYTSTPLGAVAVPTTDTFGLVLLTLVLGGIGVWYLGQRRLGDAGAA